MKHIIFIVTLISCTNIFAATANDLFSAVQKNAALQAIDSICGDTWCEGDYNFRFNEFTCDKKEKSCELNFQFIKSTEKSEMDIYSLPQTCRILNINSFHQIMDTKYSLNEEFYEEVSNCINEKEAHVEFLN